MKNNPLFKLPVSLFVFFSLIFPHPSVSSAATGAKAMVATADSHATRVALEVLQKGGNAIDAAIAAQWVLNVVEPQSSGIGGGGFILFYEASSKRIYALDGREKAPGEAFPEMFLDKDGEPYPYKPERVTGGLPVGVPGIPKLLKEAHDRFGTKRFSFSELFDPAIYFAENGFPMSKRLVYFLEREKSRLQMFPEPKKIFFDLEGNVLPVGHILKQPELAGTFRLIQKEGIRTFYEGAIAEDIVRAVKNSPFHPGVMKKSDLEAYKIEIRDAVYGQYRGYDIFGMSPPSSGGTTLIEALHILEQYDLPYLGLRADGMHLFMEAQKLAFQDRDLYLGDPEFTKVPVEKLTSKEYGKERSESILIDQASHPMPIRPPSIQGTHTSHISIVDEQGNAVAFTTTIEDIFGSCLMVPGRGFFLNNELTDFDPVPKDSEGKLVPNAPEGDKRPRSSMTPTFVFKDGKLILVLGSPGGSTIIGTVLNIIVNILDFKMLPQEAVAAPRAINRNGPAEIETLLFDNQELVENLRGRGHEVIEMAPFGNAQVIYYDLSAEVYVGTSDPRGEGEAVGY